MPKTTSGEVRRTKLRQRETDAAAEWRTFPDEWHDERLPDRGGQ